MNDDVWWKQEVVQMPRVRQDGNAKRKSIVKKQYRIDGQILPVHQKQDANSDDENRSPQSHQSVHPILKHSQLTLDFHFR